MTPTKRGQLKSPTIRPRLDRLEPIVGLDAVWMLGDILNALMAFPNLLALLALSPVVVRLTKEYFERSMPRGED